MNVRRIWKLVELCLAWTLMLGAAITIGPKANAQSIQPSAITTTHIQDTIYNADGTAATGTVLISWPSFSTAGGSSVPAGSTSVALGSNGSLSVQLVPNAGSTPMGSYYTVTYHLANGGTHHEYWVVPSQAGAVAVSTIKSSVLPASVAMQTVSKAYVDTAIAAAVTGTPADDPAEPYVLKAGDTMTGPLVLPGDPSTALQAADKNYVDGQVAAISAGLNQKVSTLPQATQTVIQPTGSELAVNRLNNVEQASLYATTSSNGIANATSSPDCASGCAVVVDPGYAATELSAPNTWNGRTQVADQRGGATTESYLNPAPPDNGGVDSARSIHVVSTENAAAQVAAGGSGNMITTGIAVTEDAVAGGSNVFPTFIQNTVPYFKSTYSAMSATGNNYTLGQHILFGQSQDCYGVGDCLMGSMFMRASGGFRDHTDEASHPFDFEIAEDNRVFDGTCASGCSTGSTLVQVNPTANGGTQGEGRYLIDTNPAKTFSTGTLIGGSPSGRHPSAIFTGTSFAVSTLLETAQTIPTQAQNIQPGTVNVAIATSGAPTGYATNTAALPTSNGVACVSDAQSPGVEPSNYETAAYHVVDASHLQLTLIRPHASGATVAVGGLCGYGLEQTVDTTGGIRQVFPVIASTSSTSLFYAGGQSALVGQTGYQGAYANLNLVIASIARSANTVTVTTAGNLPQDVNGLTMQVQGVTDSSYNGNFAVTTTGPNTLTYPSTGANSASAGGTVSVVTGGFVLYPMAEALSVFNTTTKAVDGQMTLAANTVPWASGDALEMPHYFQEQIYPDTELVTQYTPRPIKVQTAGIQYQGNLGPGVSGWVINNSVAATNYFGNGGTHAVPDAGMGVQGIWNHSLDIQAGESAAIAVHCNSHGCGKWNSAYDLFAMDTSVGQDHINYSPQTSDLTFNLRGTSYEFTPQGLTLGTLNVGTLNAGTINGGSGGSVTYNSVVTATSSGASCWNLALGINTAAVNCGQTPDGTEYGTFNLLLGPYAGQSITTANENVAIGYQALQSFTGAPTSAPDLSLIENGDNVAMGTLALKSLTYGAFTPPTTSNSVYSQDNTVIGQKAGVNAVNCFSCSLYGTHAGTGISSASALSIFGAHSFDDTTSNGFADAIVGDYVGNGNGEKDYDTLVGSGAATGLTTGSYNVMVGAQLAPHATTAYSNLVLGTQAAPGLVAGNGNLLIGTNAGPSGDTTNGFAIGTDAANGVTSMSFSMAVGHMAASHGGTLSNSTLFGYGVAGQSNALNLTDVSAFGLLAGNGLTSATGDTFFGSRAGVSVTSGNSNDLFGHLAGYTITTGSNNTIMGDFAGGSMTGTESNNEAFGANASTGAGVSNAAQIGGGTNSVNGSLQFNSTPIIDGQQNLHARVSAPAQGSACTAGAIVVNSGFIYVCVATNTWQRAALVAY